ncbi:MAG TPA: ATP phosphoribosyltransferase regulatory subunit, partial [Pseudomonadales bacterium]|nr:ATP phosphoribosyltransferase regulatory subunit [Pseudomonadales bacterium]
GLIAQHCGFAEEQQAGFFITFDKLDKLGPEGVLAELREAGYPNGAIERFERLLPTLQKRELPLEALPAALGMSAARRPEAFESLAWIIRTAGGEIPPGARVQFDPTLVRGMGYYTGAIFEMVSPAFPSSIAGGGRYDRMIGRLLGREVPACGFSIGFERLITILTERGMAPSAPEAMTSARRIALLVDTGGDLAAALAAARELRAKGDLVSLELKRKNVGKQLDDFVTHGFWGYATGEAGGQVTVKAFPGTGGRS